MGLTKGVAADIVSQDIRANLIAPGTKDRPSFDNRARGNGDYEKACTVFIVRQPIRYFRRAKKIASLAFHFASDKSAYTTGVVYAADGEVTT